ncbi:hypothetical protein LTS09_016773 [Friedmanniomyces endolithicus]|nr:hypothetical protein LTS09_016773 [Friedmanniomyces endolithicus]
MQDMTKPEERLSIGEYGSDDKPGAALKGGTAFDEQEMQRMGKVQELRVSFMAVTVTMSDVGEHTACKLFRPAQRRSVFQFPSRRFAHQRTSGTGGVIWCTIAVWLLMLCTIASMAEMASMCPTAGGKYWVALASLPNANMDFPGQYHWVDKGFKALIDNG